MSELLSSAGIPPFASSAGMLVLIALVGLAVTLYARGEEYALGVALVASLLASPLLWHHYLALMLIPIATLARRLTLLGRPNSPARQLVVATSLLFLLGVLSATAVATPALDLRAAVNVSILASVGTKGTNAGLVWFVYLLLRTDRPDPRAPLYSTLTEP